MKRLMGAQAIPLDQTSASGTVEAQRPEQSENSDLLHSTESAVHPQLESPEPAPVGQSTDSCSVIECSAPPPFAFCNDCPSTMQCNSRPFCSLHRTEGHRSHYAQQLKEAQTTLTTASCQPTVNSSESQQTDRDICSIGTCNCPAKMSCLDCRGLRYCLSHKSHAKHPTLPTRHDINEQAVPAEDVIQKPESEDNIDDNLIIDSEVKEGPVEASVEENDTVEVLPQAPVESEIDQKDSDNISRSKSDTTAAHVTTSDAGLVERFEKAILISEQKKEPGKRDYYGRMISELNHQVYAGKLMSLAHHYGVNISDIAGPLSTDLSRRTFLNLFIERYAAKHGLAGFSPLTDDGRRKRRSNNR